MLHSVALTLSTQRAATATVFLHSFALFTFLNRQETQQENNCVSLSKTQLNSESYWIGRTTDSPAATSLTLSLTCFAHRNSLAVSLLSG